MLLPPLKLLLMPQKLLNFQAKRNLIFFKLLEEKPLSNQARIQKFKLNSNLRHLQMPLNSEKLTTEQ